jgi:hypothetical protein
LINIDGELVYLENNWTKKEPISKEYKNTNFHGILNFYKSYVTESDNLYMIDFFAKFTDGFIVNITPNVQSMPKRVIVEDVDTLIEKLLDN